jgi:undecaprenyl-diphosphatase
MSPSLLQILLLGLIQGAAELLPVSSSAHVIVVEKLLHLDPSSPEMTFLLVMLHTGTMFAVIAYFWPAWRKSFFADALRFKAAATSAAVATVATGVVYLVLKELIEKVVMHGSDKAEVEQLFSNLWLIGGALAAAGVLILVSARSQHRRDPAAAVGLGDALWIGAVQGICLPFRGFSRSGATISTGLLRGVAKMPVEEFSFALAVILTPAAIGQELLRLHKAHPEAATPSYFLHLAGPGLAGMVCSFGAGLLALRWLSRWLEQGRWPHFGLYCLAASILIFLLAFSGY